MRAVGSLSSPLLVDPITPERETAGSGALYHAVQGGAEYPLVAIVGPTAAGKSALSLAVAERLAGEVLNYDSVQVYRGFEIGSGKVPTEDRRGIPHHFLDLIEPGQVFTAGDYRREAQQVLDQVRKRGKLPILVGGTGLYLRALLQGLFAGPTRSESLRARLREMADRRGREFLHRLLLRLDPASAQRIGPRDTPKVIRAVEVCLTTGRSFSALLARGREGLRGFRVLKIGLSPDRARLYDRINRRVEHMFREGLLEEARALLPRLEAVPGDSKPVRALGYDQAWAVLRGEISFEEAIEQTQHATRHYAKRQMTWFRPETNVTWFAGFGDDPGIQRRVLDWLRIQGVVIRVGERATERVSGRTS